MELEVQNFGEIASKASFLRLQQMDSSPFIEIAKVDVPKLYPFQKVTLKFGGGDTTFEVGRQHDVQVSIVSDGKAEIAFRGKIIVAGN